MCCHIECMDLLAVQGTLKSLLQHHSSKASILRRSAFFRVQLSHPLENLCGMENLCGSWVVLGFSVGMEVFDELLAINVPWSQEFSGVLRIWT